MLVIPALLLPLLVPLSPLDLPQEPSPAVAGAVVLPPARHGPVPSERQMRWHRLEYYGFCHFTVNTFTDQEWGFGDESEEVFQPAAFDADQWARVAHQAGMKGLIVTAKHHDGFCLWPTLTTSHSVASSPWQDGHGDVIGDVVAACRKYGLACGVYLSPWDRNHPQYGRPAYIEAYRNQLRELLGRYGEIFEVWFDGANGGTGYYGGAREERRIDRTTYYDWPETWALVRRLQPDAVIFSDAGPDIRWVGNEGGHAPRTCWARIKPAGFAPGMADQTRLGHGDPEGTVWRPAEVDVSIRPGWFYHPSQDGAVKSLEQLLDIYYASVGRGANLLLNVPPDRRGLIHENDAARLRELAEVLRLTFEKDLARNKPVTAGNVRGRSMTFAASRLTDGDRETYWATDDDVHQAALEVNLGKPTVFNRLRVQEQIRLGQRIESFTVEAHEGRAWREIAQGTTIGPRRILRFPAEEADRLRLTITASQACPTLSTLELYLAPAKTRVLPDQRVFIESLQVTLQADVPGAEIYYTLDGTDPGPESRHYTGPITLDHSVVLAAAAWVGKMPGLPITRAEFTCYRAKDLRPAVTFRSPVKPGVRYEYFEGDWQTLRQMEGRTPAAHGIVKAFDLGERKRDEHFAFRFTGLIDVPRDGLYTFSTESDDGSALFIDDEKVVGNDRLQGMTERRGVIGLRRGRHSIRVEYFNASGGLGLRVRWQAAGLEHMEIPPELLGHTADE